MNAGRRRAFSRVRPPGKSYLAFLRTYNFDASASQMSHLVGDVPGSKKARLHSGTAAGGSADVPPGPGPGPGPGRGGSVPGWPAGGAVALL